MISIEITTKDLKELKEQSYDSGVGSYDHNRGVGSAARTLRGWMRDKFLSEHGYKENEWGLLQTEDMAYCPKDHYCIRFTNKDDKTYCGKCGKEIIINRDINIVYIPKPPKEKKQ